MSETPKRDPMTLTPAAYQELDEARAELRMFVSLIRGAGEVDLDERDVFGLYLTMDRIAERMDRALETVEFPAAAD